MTVTFHISVTKHWWACTVDSSKKNTYRGLLTDSVNTTLTLTVVKTPMVVPELRCVWWLDKRTHLLIYLAVFDYGLCIYLLLLFSLDETNTWIFGLYALSSHCFKHKTVFWTKYTQFVLERERIKWICHRSWHSWNYQAKSLVQSSHIRILFL